MFYIGGPPSACQKTAMQSFPKKRRSRFFDTEVTP